MLMPGARVYKEMYDAGKNALYNPVRTSTQPRRRRAYEEPFSAATLVVRAAALSTTVRVSTLRPPGAPCRETGGR